MIEMLGVAAGLDMEVRVVACDPLCLHGIVGVVGSQLLELIENLLTDEEALLHPPDLTGRDSDLNEAAIVVEDFDAISVFHQAGFLVDGGHMVAEIDLDSGNVSDLKDAASGVTTGRQESEQECESRKAQRCGERLHGVTLQYIAERELRG